MKRLILIAMLCAGCHSPGIKGWALPWNWHGWGSASPDSEILPTYIENDQPKEQK